MFPLPVANGKNRPTTLASTQFGGSGIVIFNFIGFFFLNNVKSVVINVYLLAEL